MTKESLNPTSRWDAAAYATTGAFVPALGDAVLALLAPQTGERVLDVGCGDGALTARIAAAGAEVVGYDASESLVAAARARGLVVHLGDAARLPFDGEFDAVFSNAALHWMLDPGAVARGMFASLRPGGRLAVEFGGFGNIAAIRTALAATLARHGVHERPADQYYPTPPQYADVLRAAGFDEITTWLVPRPTLVAAGMVAWLETFRGGLLDALGVHGDERRAIFAETAELLEPALRAADGTWWADYVRIRATARRGGGEPPRHAAG